MFKIMLYLTLTQSTGYTGRLYFGRWNLALENFGTLSGGGRNRWLIPNFRWRAINRSLRQPLKDVEEKIPAKELDPSEVVPWSSIILPDAQDVSSALDGDRLFQFATHDSLRHTIDGLRQTVNSMRHLPRPLGFPPSVRQCIIRHVGAKIRHGGRNSRKEICEVALSNFYVAPR
jgi:hypothetical protein